MSDIAKVRDILGKVIFDLAHTAARVRAFGANLHADDLDRMNQDLRTARKELKREPAIRKARKASARLTPRVALKIHDLARANPNMTIHEIATATGVRNAARVSETLNGKRNPQPGLEDRLPGT